MTRSEWEDYMGRHWVGLSTSSEKEHLEALLEPLTHLIWPGCSWKDYVIHSTDEIQIDVGHTSRIGVLKERWVELSEAKQVEIVAFAEGFLLGFDTGWSRSH